MTMIIAGASDAGNCSDYTPHHVTNLVSVTPPSRETARGVARREQRAATVDGAVCPQPSNTGAQITRGGLIDWLEGTFTRPEINLLDVSQWCLTWLPPGASPLERGSMGYTHGWRLAGGGLLLYNPQRPEMGVHFSLPSGSLSLLADDPYTVIARVLAEGGHFTRLDVACDTDQVTMDQVRAACTPRPDAPKGDCVTRAKSAPTWSDMWNPQGGETIYIGSLGAGCRRLVRFYDKAKEQGVEGVWVRCEVQFRRDQAQEAALHILQGADLAALIVSAVDFRDTSADSNVSRCPRAAWWESWIGSVKRVSFAAKKQVVDEVAKAFEWVRKQVGPTLAFLDAFFTNENGVPNYRWLWDLCESNTHRMSPQHRLLLQMEGGAL